VVLAFCLISPDCKKAQSPWLDVRLHNQNDKIVQLRDLAHKPLVLEFWSSWCAQCRESTRTLNRLRSKLSDETIVLGVNTDENLSPAAVANAAHSFEMSFETVLDPDLRLYDALCLVGIPAIALLESNGTNLSVFYTNNGDGDLLAFLNGAHSGVRK